MKIALLDDEISEYYLKILNIQEYTLNGEVKQEQVKTYSKSKKKSHGLICASILRKAVKEQEVIFISIMDKEEIKGDIKILCKALVACLKIGVDIICLSVGTTKLSDAKLLYPIVKMAHQNDVIIVAAQSNQGYLTFPAGFKEVYGVIEHKKNKEKSSLVYFKQNKFGIDFGGECLDEYQIFKECIYKGNSFVVPVVVGYITRMLQNESCYARKKEVINRKRKLQTKIGKEEIINVLPDEAIEIPCVLISPDVFNNKFKIQFMMDYLYKRYKLESLCLSKKVEGDCRFQRFTDVYLEHKFIVDIDLIWMWGINNQQYPIEVDVRLERKGEIISIIGENKVIHEKRKKIRNIIDNVVQILS